MGERCIHCYLISDEYSMGGEQRIKTLSSNWYARRTMHNRMLEYVIIYTIYLLVSIFLSSPLPRCRIYLYSFDFIN